MKMKKIYLSLTLATSILAAKAQNFNKQIDVDFDFLSSTIVMPTSPLKVTPLFIGGVDSVATFNGSDAFTGHTTSKDWNDFIGITSDENNPGEFWVTVNHEKIEANPLIGDGGGMTVFKAKETPDGDIIAINQTLHGKNVKFSNVNFKDFVGETGMNCGGIVAPNGRIWTAEEWFRTSNASLGGEVKDTSDFTITTDIAGDFNGQIVRKYENFNYMVEVDPREAKAIRKQYNWGRQGFEGGAISKDMKTVYLGVDANPAFLSKFVADQAGDFTSGKSYVFKASNAKGARWVEIDNSKLENMLNYTQKCIDAGATMYNRLEWVVMDTTSGIVYLTETGRDDIGNKWADELAEGAELAAHHVARGAENQATEYADYYGRVLAFNPETEEVTVHIEAGADDSKFDNQSSVSPKFYPTKHLSNPDGLSIITMGNQPYLIIQEDLNGTSHNRVPYGVTNRACEVFLLDLSIANPTVKDLIRVTVGPIGSEVTGATSTPSGKAILLNIQHPNNSTTINEFPYNNSVTVAITGFEGILNSVTNITSAKKNAFVVYPNPVSRELHFDKTTDIAIYTATGTRIKVARNTKSVTISDLDAGTYIVTNKDGESAKIIIE